MCVSHQELDLQIERVHNCQLDPDEDLVLVVPTQSLALARKLPIRVKICVAEQEKKVTILTPWLVERRL